MIVHIKKQNLLWVFNWGSPGSTRQHDRPNHFEEKYKLIQIIVW